jgi:hypothetical protein
MHALARDLILRRSTLLLLPFVLGACGPAVVFIRDHKTRPMSRAHNQDAEGMRIEVTPLPTQPYYLSSSARRPGTPFGAYRRYVFIDLGYQNPMVAYRSPSLRNRLANLDSAYQVCRGRNCPFSVELSLPVSVHLLWDAFTGDSPIATTDYKFGADLSARISFQADHEQRVRMYWGHISSHVGDEYLNGARTDPIYPFPRVNLSYFPWRVGLSDRWFPDRNQAWTYNSFVEVGLQAERSCFVGCTATGYYTVDSTQTDGVVIPLIPNGVEYSLTADWRVYTAARTYVVGRGSREPHSFDVSALMGSRRVFPYVQLPMNRSWDPVLSATVGGTWSNPDPHSVASVRLYGRYFNGPNPNGQLRNQRHFHYWSLGMQLR